MALISCSECGHKISSQAPSCPSCGKPTGVAQAAPKKKTSGCAWIALVFFILVGLGTCSAIISGNKASEERAAEVATAASAKANRSPAEFFNDVQSTTLSATDRLAAAIALIDKHPTSDEAKAAGGMLEDLKEQIRLENLGKQWNYAARPDEMTGKRTSQASVRSTNTHEFEFPYHRPQHATLTLRDHPRFGKDVIISIERGQLLCSSYSGCYVMVRFDEGQPRRYEAAEAADNSSDTLFITNQADFRRRMQSAQTVRIATQIYQEGEPIWEFDVSGFKPDEMK